MTKLATTDDKAMWRDLRPSVKPKREIKDPAEYLRIRIDQLAARKQKQGYRPSLIERTREWFLDRWHGCYAFRERITTILLIPVFPFFLVWGFTYFAYEEGFARPRRRRYWARLVDEGKLREGLARFRRTRGADTDYKVARELWANHAAKIFEEMRAKGPDADLAWLAFKIDERKNDLDPEERIILVFLKLIDHLEHKRERVSHEFSVLVKSHTLPIELRLTACADFCKHAQALLVNDGEEYLRFFMLRCGSTVSMADYLAQHLMRDGRLSDAHVLVSWRAKTSRQEGKTEQVIGQLNELATLLREIAEGKIKHSFKLAASCQSSRKRSGFPMITLEGNDLDLSLVSNKIEKDVSLSPLPKKGKVERTRDEEPVRPPLIWPVVTGAGADFLIEASGELGYFCLPMDRGPTRDRRTLNNSSDAVAQLLRLCHGLKSVLPTAFLSPTSDQAEFQQLVHTREFGEEIDQETNRTLSEDLTLLLEKLAKEVAFPLQRRFGSKARAAVPSSVHMDRDSPFAFLPMNAALVGTPKPRFDQRTHQLPPIGHLERRLKCRILIIRDPSESLVFEDVEIEGIERANILGETVVLTLQELFDKASNEQLGSYDVLHFIGHHAISYADGIVSNIPTTKGTITSDHLWRAFRATGCHLVFLSACATNSTFFTDRDARADAFAMQCVENVNCNVVSTLWPILDFSAAHFAANYYSELGRSEGDPFSALNQTQERFSSGEIKVTQSDSDTDKPRLGGSGRRKTTNLSEPIHWAGYVLN